MQQLDDYLSLRTQIFAYFGYVENWRVLPLEDNRKMYWRLDGEGPGDVEFATTPEGVGDEDGSESYSNEIYTQRHLPKWVYRSSKYTMIAVDTHTDGNQFLAIFDNAKEVTL